MDDSKQVIIIGNGIGGVTAARYIRKRSDVPITIISAESRYAYSRTALMYIYMGHLSFEETKLYEDWFWEKNRINLIQAYVWKIESQEKRVHLSNGKIMHFDQLIIASGSVYNKFGWPGQDLDGVSGLYSLQDLEYIETYTRDCERAVLVGGGLIGIELAEMLLSRHIEVTFLVREDGFWGNVLPAEESDMVCRHMKEHHIDLRTNTELKEIVPDENGRVKAIITHSGEEIPCQFVGLTAGVKPNITFIDPGSGIQTDKGILVNRFFETSAPGIYAIGDCAQLRDPLPGRRSVEQVWYLAKMHGETVAMTVTGERTEYKPPYWFNSAKFLDIEYQNYGAVHPRRPEDIETLYWEDKSGKKSVRINYRKEDQVVIGFNLFGVRMRHEVCDRWLREKRDLRHVLTHLRAANFDPEFYRSFEKNLVSIYNQSNSGNPIKLKSKRSLKQMIFG